LRTSEFVVRVFGAAGGLLDRIGFDTNYGSTFGPWGGPGGYAFSIPGVAIGFFGNDFRGSNGGLGVSVLGVYTRLDQRQRYSKWQAGINWQNCEIWDDGSDHASNTVVYLLFRPFKIEEWHKFRCKEPIRMDSPPHLAAMCFPLSLV
jgi:hypothetical protein